ncbi:hypothetical protein HYZ97_01430 [Candidatus Pacearchaeota archaeon]|nr:hypothetical protein [Candidatus Pacearchaeota archaeon]
MNSGLFIVGLIVLIGGLFAAGYGVDASGNYFFGPNLDPSSRHPYGSFAVFFITIGLVVMIIGALMPEVITTRETSTVLETPKEKHTKVVVREN